VTKRAICLDFETASACDLKEAGAWRYAEDPTTEVLCLCWQDPKTGSYGRWAPGLPDEGELRSLVNDPDVVWIAHNAGFEKAIWRRIMVPVFGFPDVPNELWHDTMAVCAMKAIPQKLEQAIHTLGLPLEKDMDGSRYTIGLSKFNKKTGKSLVTGADMPRVYRYCDSDVASELALHRRIGWQSPEERQVWLLDQEINERGVKLDLGFVAASQRVVAGAMAPLLTSFRQITNGLAPTQTAKVVGWCAKQGNPIPNLQKETIVNWLGEDIDGAEPDYGWDDDDWRATELSGAVREVLSIRQVTASSSVKKLARMDACVGADGRVRGCLSYHGAGPGRWAGRLFQPQNFPRPIAWDDWKDKPSIEQVVEAIRTGGHEYVEMVLGPPVQAVVSGLRHAIIADDKSTLLAGDFAGIEARVVLALAGQHDKCALLEAGMDPYVDFAATALKVPTSDITKRIRQDIGKPGVLGCGFQMGWRKLALKYKVPEADAQTIVDGYRQDWAPLVPKVWYGLERAAVHTVHTGSPSDAYGVSYRLEDGWLTARLPSGRKLWYWDPRPCRKAMPWDKTDVRPSFTYRAFKQGHMVTVNAYGGLLTENVVQALARDLLVYAMFQMRKNGFPIILTVHDEILCEVLRTLADEKAFGQIMVDRPRWAIEMGIPVQAETWAGDCYRK
jgi:DNA polymerase bacteriophage-type